MPVVERRPSHVPVSFTLRDVYQGAGDARTMHAGFGRESEQVVLVYTPSSDPSGWDIRLTVSIARAGAGPLVATSRQRGRPIDLGLPGLSAIYHDGVMVAGTNARRQFTGPVWLTGTVHSITASSSTGTFAVRGPKSVPVTELAQVIKSLDPTN